MVLVILVPQKFRLHWSPSEDDFRGFLAALSPKLLISQHEDEIGAHGIDHREAFWMTLYKNDKIYHFDVPYVLMGWGEWYDCK